MRRRIASRCSLSLSFSFSIAHSRILCCVSVVGWVWRVTLRIQLTLDLHLKQYVALSSALCRFRCPKVSLSIHSSACDTSFDFNRLFNIDDLIRFGP